MFALVVACGGSESFGDRLVAARITQTAVLATSTPASSPTPPVEPTSLPLEQTTPVPEGPITGFTFPIEGACLPLGDQLMPNAPREYRQGIHEGIDFYNIDNCTEIGLGTPVVAAKAGTILRIDHDYVDITAEEMEGLLANPRTEEALDRFRGRQVWIDHGDGTATRYCHLSGVVAELQVGARVEQGQTIAFVGESGTPSSINAPGSEFHLHWELRVADSYLGAGQDPASVRDLYLTAFGLQAP